MHILYIEDDVLNQQVLVMLLAALGYKDTTVAENAKKAMEILQNTREPFDLILMDLGLPDIDGITLTKEIREHHLAEKNVPIIALTGNDIGSSREKCFAAGMDEFLAKPIEVELLKKTMKKFLFNKH